MNAILLIAGIPGYNAFRTLCGLPPAKDFNDLKDLIPAVVTFKFISKLKIYKFLEFTFFLCRLSNDSSCYMNQWTISIFSSQVFPRGK